MNIVKLNEKLNPFFESLEDIIKGWIYINPVKELGDKIDDPMEELAKAYGYQLYDNNLVIDVKGRPNIKPEVAEKIKQVNDELGYQYEGQILEDRLASFMDDLGLQFPNFVVCGRSGGYWGLSNASDNLVYTEKFKQALADLIKASDDPEETLYNLPESKIAQLITDDYDMIDFDEDYIKELKQIEQAINEEEESINSLDSWEIK